MDPVGELLDGCLEQTSPRPCDILLDHLIEVLEASQMSNGDVMIRSRWPLAQRDQVVGVKLQFRPAKIHNTETG